MMSIIRRSLRRMWIMSDSIIRGNSVVEEAAAPLHKVDHSLFPEVQNSLPRGPLSYLRFEGILCIQALLQVRIRIALDRVTAVNSPLLVLSTIGPA